MTQTLTKTNGQAAERAPAQAGRAPEFTPRADVLETPEELVLLLDLPGVKPGNLELDYERGELTVHGRWLPPQQEGRSLLAECPGGDYHRVFLLGQEVDASDICAELKGGVLTVHLPKVEGARPRRVPVRGA